MADAPEMDLDAIEARAAAATDGPWEETWRPIPGVDGYEVSDFGNVRSFFRPGNHKQKRSQEARLLALRSRKTGGYRGVSLPTQRGSYTNRAVHRLVMLAFVGPCPEGHEVAHLNGDPSDNRLCNLKYVTHRENEAHKVAHGTRGIGEANSMATMQGWQVAEIKYLAEKSVPQGRLAALFGISHQRVSEILGGRAWASEPARTDVPALVAEVRRLRAELDEVHEALTSSDSDRFHQREELARYRSVGWGLIGSSGRPLYVMPTEERAELVRGGVHGVREIREVFVRDEAEPRLPAELPAPVDPERMRNLGRLFDRADPFGSRAAGMRFIATPDATEYGGPRG